MSESRFQTVLKSLFLEEDGPLHEASRRLKEGTVFTFEIPGHRAGVRRRKKGFTMVRAGREASDFDFQFADEDAFCGLREVRDGVGFGQALLALWADGRLKATPIVDFTGLLDKDIVSFLFGIGILSLPPDYIESLRTSRLKDIAFTEILDVGYLQGLIDDLAKIIGVRLWVMDMNCIPVAISSTGGDHCRLIANSLAGGIRCYTSAIDSIVELRELLVPRVRKCHAGFICFDAPLILNGEMVGMISGDAALDMKTSAEEYQALARELEIDGVALVSSLSKVGHLRDDEIQLILSVVDAIGKVVTEMSFKQYMLSEKVNELTGLHQVSSLVTRPLPEDLDEIYAKIAEKVGSLKKGGYCKLNIKRDGRLKVFEGGLADCPEQMARQKWSRDIRIGKKKMGSIELAMPRVPDLDGDTVDDHFFASLVSQLSLAMQNSDLYGELRGKNEELRLFLHAITQVQEKERASLARDLHDDTGQNLTNALLHLDLVLKDKRLAERYRQHLVFAEDAISVVLEQLRDLSVRLHPLMLDDLGLVEALTDFLQRMNSEHPIRFSLDVYGEEKPLSAEAKINIYRIVQEALSNAVQHSEAEKATVLVEYETDGMNIIIADDGKGRRKSQGERKLHLGLASMRERCEQMGGAFNFISSSNGTLVTLQLPHTIFQDENGGYK